MRLRPRSRSKVLPGRSGSGLRLLEVPVDFHVFVSGVAARTGQAPGTSPSLFAFHAEAGRLAEPAAEKSPNSTEALLTGSASMTRSGTHSYSLRAARSWNNG